MIFVKQFVGLLLLMLVYSGIHSQEIKVVNAHTGAPVEGVLVISNNNPTVQTGDEGRADLTGIRPGDTLLFQHASYLRFATTKEKVISSGKIVFLVEDPVRLDEVVVSVNRWQQSKTEIPHKIETIRSSDVLHYQPQTSADLLGTQEGVFIQKSQMGGGSPMIRGFAANRVLIVVDGIRMNNAIFRSGNLHNVISLDAHSLESAEVIFGPGSVIYGSDALGGVMSFNTLNPKLSTTDKSLYGGQLLTRWSGANKEKTIHGALNYGSGKWAGVASATYSTFDDLRMGAHGPDEYLRTEVVDPGDFDGTDRIISNNNPRIQKFSGYNQLNLLSKLRFRPSGKLDLVWSIHHSRSSDIPRYDRLIARRDNQLRYGEWYYGPQKWTLFSGQMKYREDHALFDKLNVLAGGQLFAESRHDRNLHQETLRHRKENLSVFSLNLDLGKTFNEKHEIFYGGEAFLNHVGSSAISENLLSGVEEDIAPRYPDDSDYKSYAAYFSWKYKMHDRLIFHAGSRYTRTLLSGKFDPGFYSFPFPGFDMKNSALNGNLGVVWHPASGWQVNLNASTGFRSPNIDDVAKVFDSEPGNVIVPNPGLEPEYARNVEVGIIRSYAARARFELTGFYTRLKNAMVRRNFSINGQDSILYDGIMSDVEALVNAESATIYGGSLSFEYLFSPSFRTRHDFTLTLGEDAQGIPLRHVPPSFGSAHLLLETGKFFVDFFIDYNGSLDYEQLAPSEKDKPHLYALDANGNPWSPSWWTANIQTNYSVSDAITLSGGIKNMLNKRYRTYSSGIVAPGMNFIFSLQLKM